MLISYFVAFFEKRWQLFIVHVHTYQKYNQNHVLKKSYITYYILHIEHVLYVTYIFFKYLFVCMRLY